MLQCYCAIRCHEFGLANQRLMEFRRESGSRFEQIGDHLEALYRGSGGTPEQVPQPEEK